MIKSVEWTGDSLKIIDQTALPDNLVYKELYRVEDVFEAIQKLRVRGAPALGVAGAFGLYLGWKHSEISSLRNPLDKIKEIARYLDGARPTAINLRWALQEVILRIEKIRVSADQVASVILKEAQAILKDDEQRCLKIGENGAALVRDNMTILTHCNTGALATAGIGTALGVITTAFRQGKKVQVLVDETRPLLQGARLTMWELQQAKVPATLITDNMAAFAMKKGKVDLVIVGADRIAANGDVANKIGTYQLAITSRFHDVPFYVAAPLSTFDFSNKSGDEIPIEERDGAEITRIWDRLGITVSGARTWNPAFDITPASLIKGIITERRILNPPFEKAIKELN